jgi:hypothetical protein
MSLSKEGWSGVFVWKPGIEGIVGIRETICLFLDEVLSTIGRFLIRINRQGRPVFESGRLSYRGGRVYMFF